MKTVYDRIHDMRGNLIKVRAKNVGLGELARIDLGDGRSIYASVLRIDGDEVTLQVFQNTRGISTGDKVTFLSRQMQGTYGKSLLGRRLKGTGEPIDGGPSIVGEKIDIGQPSFNPIRRIVPREMVRTNIPMIDVFNCLVKSQKIPIFSIPGEPYNNLLMRIANQTDADVVIIGGMGLTFADYQAFIDNAEQAGSLNKTVMFIHRAVDPAHPAAVAEPARQDAQLPEPDRDRGKYLKKLPYRRDTTTDDVHDGIGYRQVLNWIHCYYCDFRQDGEFLETLNPENHRNSNDDHA